MINQNDVNVEDCEPKIKWEFIRLEILNTEKLIFWTVDNIVFNLLGFEALHKLEEPQKMTRYLSSYYKYSDTLKKLSETSDLEWMRIDIKHMIFMYFDLFDGSLNSQCVEKIVELKSLEYILNTKDCIDIEKELNNLITKYTILANKDKLFIKNEYERIQSNQNKEISFLKTLLFDRILLNSKLSLNSVLQETLEVKYKEQFNR